MKYKYRLVFLAEVDILKTAAAAKNKTLKTVYSYV